VVNRRQSLRRLLINPPVLVSLGTSRSDLLFDLSEGGLSVYGEAPKHGNKVFPIEFRLPGDFGAIKGRGEIAWSSKSRNLTGVRFIGLSDNSRLQLRNWMVTRLPPAAPYVGDYEISRPSLVSQFAKTLGRGTERSDYPSRSILVISVLVSAIFLCALEGSRYYSKSVQNEKREKTVAVMPQPRVDEPPTARDASPVSPRISASSHVPGFVLQVGAMRQESNADALLNSLKQQGFPVIVFRSTTDRFYRVAVGPYHDMATVTRVKNELKVKNFESIVRRGVPE
jgi:hypothetical protein